MASGRPLHELLADLAGDADAARAHGDPETYLAANGHPDLPPDLVAEAVVSYADTAPVEVAEHLAPYVTTHSAVPTDEPPAEDWFGLLTTAPAEDLDADPGLDVADDQPSSPDHDRAAALDFGAGSTDLDGEPASGGDSADDSAPESSPESSPEPSASASGSSDDSPDQEPSTWTDLENVDLDALDDPDDDLN
jgi:hypothetical protein